MTPEPENRLYQAVVVQAFYDATAALSCDGGVAGHAADINRARARRWLLSDEDSFPIICVAALLDPFYIRDGARALQARGWPEPPRAHDIRKIRAAPSADEDSEAMFGYDSDSALDLAPLPRLEDFLAEPYARWQAAAQRRLRAPRV